MALPKWTEERETELRSYVGDETPVSQETVADAATHLETSARSISSKLRKMGFEVELANTGHARAYTDEQEAVLRNFVTDNSGKFTYADIAESFEDGAFSAKSIQGKILSMELTSHIKAAPKPESVKTYSDSEEDTFVKMVQDGSFVEDIAAALKRETNSIRGKALSLLRAGVIEAIPRQKNTKAASRQDALEGLGDISSMTVAEIAEAIEKSPRGVKTMLTRRGLTASDYDGAAKAAKAAANG